MTYGDILAPTFSTTVRASAGSGKTHLLVTRITRLLLEGVAPDTILAITFTRKAAAEMARRLSEQLQMLASSDDNTRRNVLRDLGLSPDPILLSRAATLYETSLREPRQVRTATFHSFCQEILRRFPLEAEIPAGFELVTQEGLLQQEAWEGLIEEATHAPDGELGQALDLLFHHIAHQTGVQTALMEFLQRRSDWWAYTQGEPDPVAYATSQLARHLDIQPNRHPDLSFLNAALKKELGLFAAGLMRHGTATSLGHAASIETTLNQDPITDEGLDILAGAFLKKDGTPLIRKSSKALVTALGGDANMHAFLALNERLSAIMLDLKDLRSRHRTWQLSRAWLFAGVRLLDRYQRLKAEQRLLDFNDLEWKAYVLLNHADHALWIQYKLDQRIDHLLVDEFQDTNPTQWRLIFPLLEELAAGAPEKPRSLFLVGDDKQSIYRFRRADPALLTVANAWIVDRLQGKAHNLSVSWRSSPVITEFVNRVFGSGLLPGFPLHTAQHNRLWGEVEVLPLIDGREESLTSSEGLRNPLQQPRHVDQDQRYIQEGRALARRIKRLIDKQIIVEQEDNARPISYEDIMILVRRRTHVPAYEQALREAGIPYASANRGTLLDCIEVQDLQALIEILIMPYNNLALAQVLRSPLFACTDEDLIELAGTEGENWFSRLLQRNWPAGAPLARAAHWLPHWQHTAGKLPVHDLLDRIYYEGQLVQRYEAAFPAVLRARVRANLDRFIDLALTVDSGRYPSLSHFLYRLRHLRVSNGDAPDEASVDALRGVRLLTVHAAKGLEASAVFVADAASATQPSKAYSTLVRWPSQADRPTHFFLIGKGKELDRISKELLDEQLHLDQREQNNLLYVALTRAKQLLYLSGCRPARGENLGWYGAVAERLGDTATIATQGWCSRTELSMPSRTLPSTPRRSTFDTKNPPPFAGHPLSHTILERHAVSGLRQLVTVTAKEKDDRSRAIRRLLAWLTTDPSLSQESAFNRLTAELALGTPREELEGWWRETLNVIHHPTCQSWFYPAKNVRTYNEISLQYCLGNHLIQGTIDRLLIDADRCTLISYQTHPTVTGSNLQEYLPPHQESLRLYREGVRRLCPDKAVYAYLLFTACPAIYLMEEP